MGEAAHRDTAPRPRDVPMPRLSGWTAARHAGQRGSPHRRQGRGAAARLDTGRDRPSEQFAGNQPRMSLSDHVETGSWWLVAAPPRRYWCISGIWVAKTEQNVPNRLKSHNPAKIA